jgi:hypothetical protein
VVRADPKVAGRVYVLALTSCIGFCPQFESLSRSDDGGSTFTLLKTLPATPNPDLAVDPLTGDVFVWNFTKPGELAVYRTGRFDEPEILGQNTLSVSFDPQSPGTMYVSLTSGTIVRSDDDGRTFQTFVTLPTPAGTILLSDGSVILSSQVGTATDGFVFKYDSLGNTSYGTYLGGGQTRVSAAALAPNGHLFVAGSTAAGLPTANAIQPKFGGSTDGFLAEFDASGALAASTYLGGSDAEQIDSMTLLADGSVLLIGSGASSDFARRDSAIGGGSLIVLKITP